MPPKRLYDLLQTLGDKDEADLTTEELKKRLAEFQETEKRYKGYNPEEVAGKRNQFRDYLKQVLFNRGSQLKQPEQNLASIAEQIANSVSGGQVYDYQTGSDKFDLRQSLRQLGIDERQANDIAYEVSQAAGQPLDYFYGKAHEDESKTTAESIKRLQDIISGREQEASKEQDLQNTLTAIPDELSKARLDYGTVLDQTAAERLQDYAQGDALTQANVSGNLYSGDSQDYLTSYAGNLQADNENIMSALEADDKAFFADAAYRFQLRKTLEGRDDYRTALDSERNRIRTDQEQRFYAGQSSIGRATDEEFQRRRYESQYKAQEERLRRERDHQNRAGKSALYGQAGQLGGAIVGAAVGGPVGSQIGSSTGGVAGGEIGRVG